MDQSKFVEAIKTAVLTTSITAIENTLIKPAGRQPDKRIVELSNWFNTLSSPDKKILMEIVAQTAHMSVFGFFCVLDGVRAIEPAGEKGDLILTFTKNEKSVWLNNAEEGYLHDLL